MAAAEAAADPEGFGSSSPGTGRKAGAGTSALLSDAFGSLPQRIRIGGAWEFLAASQL
jgi:hypothetical protein